MKNAMVLVTLLLTAACGNSSPPANPTPPSDTGDAATTAPTASATPAASATATAAPADTTASATPDAGAPAPDTTATPDGGKGKKRTRSMRQGTITAGGKLSQDAVQKAVRQHFGQFLTCYEKGLEKNDKLEGKILTSFSVDAKGKVSKVKDAGSDMPDKDVVTCVQKVFPDITFPASEGTSTVTYPLMLAPGS